jgi:predicted DNA binding CopG/RHH family protein
MTTEARQRELKQAARRHLQKHQTKMNIRIDQRELERIKTQANKEGLRYQTLVKSVLHKYLTGQLVDRDSKTS